MEDFGSEAPWNLTDKERKALDPDVFVKKGIFKPIPAQVATVQDKTISEQEQKQ